MHAHAPAVEVRRAGMDRGPYEVTVIGRTRVVAVDGSRLRVQNLEAVDGTPIIDMKPVLASETAER